MGAIADRLYKFLDSENESGQFVALPADAAEARDFWADALSGGIKELMATANGLGVGMPGLPGVDTAFSPAEFPVQGPTDDLWDAIDTSIDTLMSEVETNTAAGTLALAGFDQQQITLPTWEDIANTDDGSPLYEEGIVEEGTPPTDPPSDAPCGSAPTGGSAPVMDTGFDLANRLEEWIATKLATGNVIFTMSSLGVTVPVPSWIIPPPDGSKSKDDVLNDIISGLNDDDVPKESIDQESDEPFDNNKLKGIFDMCILLLEKSKEEDVSDSVEEDAIEKAEEYLDELVFYNIVTRSPSPPPYTYEFVGLAEE